MKKRNLTHILESLKLLREEQDRHIALYVYLDRTYGKDVVPIPEIEQFLLQYDYVTTDPNGVRQLKITEKGITLDKLQLKAELEEFILLNKTTRSVNWIELIVLMLIITGAALLFLKHYGQWPFGDKGIF